MPVPGEWMRADPPNGRLDFPELVLAEKRHALDAVRTRTGVEIVEPGEIALVRRDDDLAAPLGRDPCSSQ